MAKVLRLHKGASNTISNWENSTKIGVKAIDSIIDPAAATDKKEITSIPSPFARMDLVKRAFKYVAEQGLDGRTAYHKLVSDSLDVGQIFFNIEKYRDVIEIIVWDKKNQLDQLDQSGFEEHVRLGKTYCTYIQQDGDEYNFNEMDCIYLLNYTDSTGPNLMNIIGATSPATLFFTSANDLSYVKKKIKFDFDDPFDDDYRPLYKRNFDYIKYWYGLQNSRRDFAKVFPEVNLYLEKCFKELTDALRSEIRNDIQDETYYTSNYEEIPVVPDAQQYVKILDEKLRRKPNSVVMSSGFEMKISRALKNENAKIPLALPVETYTEPTIYVTDVWNKNTHVPYCDNRSIYERTLPDEASKYPYVTTSDFLEDTIVRIPYKFNSEGFFDGNDDTKDAKDSYLLPIKNIYFDYFKVDSLKGRIAGKKVYEIQRMAGGAGVKVILRIPIKSGGYIQYDRIYYKDGIPDAASNKGAIVEKEFTLGLYPSLKYPVDVKPYYRITILDADSIAGDNNPYKLSFYNKENSLVEVDGVVRRNSNSDGVRIDKYYIDSLTYVLNHDYDYIKVSSPEVSAIVVPNFAERAGSHSFRFAVDFGTTNTHIEYSIGGEASRPFDITDKDIQMNRLHVLTNEKELINIYNSDFIPLTVGGEQSVYTYPMRTVLSEGQNTNWSKAVFSMANSNIPFIYGKAKVLSYNTSHTNLKWSSNQDDKMRVLKYIESILVMLRNKVLLNNGDLHKTQLVWFYPASMTQGRFNKFKVEWEGKFKELFNVPDSSIITIPESVAPYNYYKHSSGATSNVVSVDIGGGSTDVLIVDKGNPKYVTSFQFAANSIFGDGYSFDADTNGIVNKYVPKISSILQANDFAPLGGILEEQRARKKSTDIIAFLFSLASNKEVLKKGVEIDFGKMLADDRRAKYAVVIFFVAIIYHIAAIMKAKQINMPRFIAFSGNGSKVLRILSVNNKALERLVMLIFEKVYGEAYSKDGIDIIMPDNSKESTCKGGILTAPFESQDYSQIKTMKTVLMGIDDSSFVSQGMGYDILDEINVSKVVGNCERFINFVFDLDKEFSYYDEFEVDKSIMDDVRRLCLRDIRTYLENGIALKKESIMQDGAEDQVGETFFFYPLEGILNAVVREIYKM